MKPLNLFITGGAGYIGSHVTRQLSEAGHRVVVYDNLSAGCRESLINNEELVVADLADRPVLRKALGRTNFDAVLHFAASIVVPESTANPLKYYRNNTANTIGLLMEIVEAGIPNIIFSSTAAVYGSVPSGYVSEEDVPAPMSPYGASKMMSERIIIDAAVAHGFSYTILRYFNVAGADPQGRMGQRTPDATHLIKVCCEAVLGKRNKVEIFGTDFDTPDGTGVRDYIHVEDLASAHGAALRYLFAGGTSTVLNVGYGRGHSVREVIAAAQRVSGKDFKVIEGPRRPGDPAVVTAKNEKILKMLTWVPRYNDIDTIVYDALRWEENSFKEQSKISPYSNNI